MENTPRMKQRTNTAPWGTIARSLPVAALLLTAAAITSGCDKKAAAPPAMPPMPVGTIQVQASDVAVANAWVGTLDGNVNAQIQPQVSGYLIKQNYREGAVVSKGQVLFEIDPRPFQALVDQAQGQLEQSKAAYALTQTNINRDTPLVEAHAIAKSQLDTELAQGLQAQATVKSAEASLETAKLNLGFTYVRSLISGVAGQATTQVGNLVSPQSTLTSVSQLDPVRVYFSISDSEYLGLTSKARAGKGDLLTNAAAIPLTLELANGETYAQKGRIAFVDRQMNAQTGAIRIAALFPNPGNILRPGQFARVKADTTVQHNVILVPQAAVKELQGIQQVFTVTPDNKVHVVNVQLGSQYGNDWIVQGGLQPGSTIIVDNLQKLAEGAPVNPHTAPPQPAATADAAAR